MKNLELARVALLDAALEAGGSPTTIHNYLAFLQFRGAVESAMVKFRKDIEPPTESLRPGDFFKPVDEVGDVRFATGGPTTRPVPPLRVSYGYTPMARPGIYLHFDEREVSLYDWDAPPIDWGAPALDEAPPVSLDDWPADVLREAQRVFGYDVSDEEPVVAYRDRAGRWFVTGEAQALAPLFGVPLARQVPR